MIELKNSSLQLLDFIVLKTDFSFHQPSEDIQSVNVDELFAAYPITMDFAIKTSGKYSFVVFTMISINEKENAIGHSIKVESVNFFHIKNENVVLTPETIKSLNVAAINISFNNLRGFISDITAYTPPGRYLFPIFDLSDLISKKKESVKKSKKTIIKKAISNKIIKKKKVAPKK